MKKRLSTIEEVLSKTFFEDLDTIEDKMTQYTYRITFVCPEVDIDTVLDDIEGYGVILKRERAPMIEC